MTDATNRISLSLPATDRDEILAAVKVLQDKLLPHLIDLDAQQRRDLPKMGDKTIAFVAKALDYARAHPALCPTYLDVAEFQKDIDAVQLLASLQRPLAQVVDVIDDSLLLAGSEAYAAALVFYHSVKGAARSKVQGANTIAEDLAQRFQGRPGAGVAAGVAGARPA